MSDLTTFRDYCRMRADWTPGDPRAACRERTGFGSPKPPDHGNCGGHRCGCDCHRPSDADRALFASLAGEIDAHLRRDEVAEDLFGDMSSAPSTEESEK